MSTAPSPPELWAWIPVSPAGGLQDESPDWFAIAADWYERRYGLEPPADLNEKFRRQQALAPWLRLRAFP